MGPDHAETVRDDAVPGSRALLIVLAGYFLLNFIVRMALPHSLELDEAEQSYFSQWLLAGYSSQPPLYNWLQYAVVQVFGLSLVTLSLLKNLLLFASYGFYWLAARQVLRDRRLAAVAALGLLTIPQVAFEAQRDLSHTVATIFAASLFLYCFFRALNRPSIASFILLGVATGIGGIAKYNFIVLPIAAFAAILSDRQWRSRLLDWRVLLAGAVALLIVLPHALWLVDHFAATSGHTMRKLVGDDTNPIVAMLEGFGSLALASLGFGALTTVIFAAAYRERLREVIRARNDSTRLVGRILLFSLALIVLLILFAGVERVKDRWLTPILIVLPLYFVVKIDAAAIGLQPGLRRIWGVALVIMALIPSILFGRAAVAPITGTYQYSNYPFQAFSEEIRPLTDTAPTLIVASDGQFAGNMRFNFPSTPVTTLSTPTDIRSLPMPPHRRILFVWRNSDGSMPPGFPAGFAQYLQERGLAGTVPQARITALPYNNGRPDDRYRFAYAVVDIPG
ncbi:ArnT family glycosyltransferase [Neorhizobium petrolearium]|uniref:Glycosyltransferase family 39 protein n=1 Tax=Neorhizobium petrolearium TaxID=515361 RepID=A0ABY8M452_9HYPH|nr:glycosyltransferase family 39 protein [Neorhizobium petrolearium]MCC2609100.1 glycosyltransferase family 39 protein [Neorhizobium petrolearium]WGI69331.1 glycosyltransferase family 39 protein [Neorhizobium petrolearium]